MAEKAKQKMLGEYETFYTVFFNLLINQDEGRGRLREEIHSKDEATHRRACNELLSLHERSHEYTMEKMGRTARNVSEELGLIALKRELQRFDVPLDELILQGHLKRLGDLEQKIDHDIEAVASLDAEPNDDSQLTQTMIIERIRLNEIAYKNYQFANTQLERLARIVESDYSNSPRFGEIAGLFGTAMGKNEGLGQFLETWLSDPANRGGPGSPSSK